jgi:hypothetical protein
MHTRFLPSLRWLCLCISLALGSGMAKAATVLKAEGWTEDTIPLFQEFCFKCHSDKRAKGNLNLQQLSSALNFGSLFKIWDRVVDRLETKEMPPEDEKQPSKEQRSKLISSVRGALDNYIQRNAGDPGRIAMRRLTSAEYNYSIQDLTALDLGLDRGFMGDAVGGEGFSNVGDIQFIQDSTLEHYLEAAKLVASHGVIGAGPLTFSTDPGRTGQELSAMRRIKKIYEQHGFRHESGEGGLGFGLDHYPKAFYAAWRYKHRTELGLQDVSLPQLAHQEGLDAPFVEYISQTLNEAALSFPGNEIASAWKSLPSALSPEEARAKCQSLYRLLDTWQRSLAENAGDPEVATVLTENGFHPSLTNTFRIGLAWPTGTTHAVVQLTVTPVATKNGSSAKILWRNPVLRFRKVGDTAAIAGTRQSGTPLRQFVTAKTAELLRFGFHRETQTIGTNDFVTTGSVTMPIELEIPPGTARALLTMDARLAATNTEDCVVRCVVSHQLNEGATVAATGTFSLILANPKGENIETFQAGVAEFARKFPQISHREAAPADRDPIPAPFDTTYNNPERNEFHATIKYSRDDRFLTEHILDPATRRELDQAWADLLTAFDYHQTFARFVLKKFKIELPNFNLEKLTAKEADQLPEEPARHINRLLTEYRWTQDALKQAEPGHVEDALRFAQLASRRPLSGSEKQRLRTFYEKIRGESDHPAAIQAMLARILVAPAFLYRVEPLPAATAQSGKSRIPLSDWELASRLSYFLWDSIPDAELSRAAAAGELKTPEQLSSQSQRMLRDPKARRFATEFFGQWFGFYRFDGYKGVDTTRFTEFTEDLREAMYDEAVSFFEHIVREDRPVHEILFADYSFLNSDLAQHYGVSASGLPTNNVAKFAGVNQFHRGGLLRLGAVLTSTSAPLRTSAVKRGDWLLRRVLGRGVPPPPGDAGSIPPDDVLADGKTVRQRLEAHRRDASCVNCHSRMDPLGFALEHFDSIGRWRDTYRDGQQIDASGKLNDGTEITEFEGLNAYLLKNEALFNRTLCAKLLGFALGRAEIASDRPMIDQMTAALKKDNSFSTLIRQIIESPQFRYRRAPETSAPEPKRVASTGAF